MNQTKKLSDFILDDRFELNSYMMYLLNYTHSKVSKKQKTAKLV